MTTKTAKATSIVAKILEVVSFVAFIAYIVMLILFIAKPDALAPLVKAIASDNNNELTVCGFSIVALKNGNVIQSSTIAFAIAGILSFACYTMIFRNVDLILRTAAGKTKFAKGETPFQKDITRMVREIGIFFILIPVLGLILSCVFVGNDAIGVELGGIIMGLIVITLSQIFNYGEKLESEVEGMI